MKLRSYFTFSSIGRSIGVIVLGLVVVVLGYSFVQRMFVRPPVEPRRIEESELAKRDIVIQLRILNATSVQGIARQATDYLRQRGFDVVVTDNATPQQQSRVICLRGDTTAAHQLAYAIGLAHNRVETQIDSSLVLDCSLVLGDDYKSLRIYQ